VVVALAVTGTGIRAGTDRADMGAGSHAVAVKSATGADGCNMRSGMDTMVADAGAGTHHRSDMAAGSDTVTADTRTRAGTPSVAIRANTMLVDVYAGTHAQHIDAQIHGIGGRDKQGQRAKRRGKNVFHGQRSFIRAVP
jgi:hypothetical protein